MMRLSTSTNLLDKVFDTFGVIPPEQCLRDCMEAGFESFDFNFCDQGRPGRPVAADNWQEYMNDFKKYANTIAAPVDQTHLHMYDPCDPLVENHEWETELLRRSMVATGTLGAKWAVVHPLHRYRTGFSQQDYIQANLEFWCPILKQATDMGYGLAFENMVQFTDEYVNFCNGKDLVALVEAFQSSNVGICWDFGHANLSLHSQRGTQEAELEVVGKRLKTLHVADNHGQYDEHLAPFYGEINWYSMMETLRKIGYDGDFTYEIQAFTNPLPLELRKTQTAHLAEIGKYLIKQFNK